MNYRLIQPMRFVDVTIETGTVISPLPVKMMTEEERIGWTHPKTGLVAREAARNPSAVWIAFRWLERIRYAEIGVSVEAVTGGYSLRPPGDRRG